VFVSSHLGWWSSWGIKNLIKTTQRPHKLADPKLLTRTAGSNWLSPQTPETGRLCARVGVKTRARTGFRSERKLKWCILRFPNLWEKCRSA
jgi:hypothetical protein